MVCNVLEYLEQAGEKYPDKCAFADTTKRMSYTEVVDTARRIGSGILKRGIQGRPVVVIADRDLESLMSFFGIVYAGSFYVPVDKALPVERMKTIIQVMDPGLILYQGKDSKVAEQLGETDKILTIEELLESDIDHEALEQVRAEHLSTLPLYIMFTSGSTGVPKGVVVSHGSVVDLVEQFTRSFCFDENEIFANQAPFDFDVSVKDIYLTIKNAGTMYIIPKSMFIMPKKLMQYLEENKVTTIIWAASALGVVATFKGLDKIKPLTLKNIMFSGEVLPMKVLHYWQANLSQAAYVNLYGPTEITCNCTYYKVDREFAIDEVLPIGNAFFNTEILLLDENNQKAAPGQVGEICVRGESLALGYYNNREATEKAFCQNPLHDFYRDMIYRTGDMGFYNEKGELVFASRKDHQIKHMGHRIELAEIEIQVNILEFIKKCCCVYDDKREKIVLFYESDGEHEVEIIEELQKKLPKYMCPNRMIYMEKIPMNSHEKMDRVKLKKMLGEEAYAEK
ncbi:MAG: amino acid adenylation domain-containing protein [Lachnospiraceae bacterium]|nr:amino acid adenylation domain-containing protein [Lachnospiraceae bacterium]